MIDVIRADAELISVPDLGVEGAVLARLARERTLTVATLIVGTDAFAEYQKTRSLCSDVEAGVDRFVNRVRHRVLAVRPSTPRPLIGLPTEVRGTADPDHLRYLIECVYRSWNGERARAYRLIHHLPDDDTRPAIILQALSHGEIFTLATHDARDGKPTTAQNYARSPALNRIECFPPAYREMLRAVETVTRRPTTVAFQDDQPRERPAPKVVGASEQSITGAGMIRFLRSQHASGDFDPLELLLLLDPAIIGGVSGLPTWVCEEDAVTAIPGANGAALGRVVWRGLDFDASDRPCIFLTESWYPGDFDLLSECAGAIGTEGGRASHLALACRGLMKPAVVGASQVTLDRELGSVRVGGRQFDGEFYALVDGTAGKVTFSDVKPSPVPVYTFEARVPQRDLQWLEVLATDVLDRTDFDRLSTTSTKKILELAVLVKRLRRDHA